MSAHKSTGSLTVDELSQDSDHFLKVVQDFKANAAELSRHGYIISIVRHDSHGHGSSPKASASDDISGSKNKGSTLYWKDVRRIAKERGITPSEARQVIRDRQKRRQGRPATRKTAEVLAN